MFTDQGDADSVLNNTDAPACASALVLKMAKIHLQLRRRSAATALVAAQLLAA